MQDAERQFAAENPVQISPDSQNRDCKQHETDPDADADHTVQQADAGFSKAVEYAGESGVQVQKRTDIGHGISISTVYIFNDAAGNRDCCSKFSEYSSDRQ